MAQLRQPDHIEQTILSLSRHLYPGQHRAQCPTTECRTRKKKNEKTLSLLVEDDHVIYNCWHCGIDGRVNFETTNYYKPAPQKPKPVMTTDIKTELTDKQLAWMQDVRKISAKTIQDYSLVSGSRFIPRSQAERSVIGFRYLRGEETTAIKWRSADKGFVQDGSARHFYGDWKLDTVNPAEVVITEGEMDVLSLAEAGVRNPIGVPNGAPNKPSSVAEPTIQNDDDKYGYVWDGREVLTNATRVVLLTDNDQSGRLLRDELARRIGREKCWIVDNWPEKPDGTECKDANDVLIHHGKEALAQLVAEAKPFPITGLYDAYHYGQQVNDLYFKGKPEDFPIEVDVDQLIRAVPGKLYVVTGMPKQGKSEYLDFWTVRLSERYGWKHAECSFENPPSMHIIKLAEKRSNAPFFEGPTKRMTPDQKDRAMQWVNDHYVFINEESGGMTNIDRILANARAAVLRHGIRTLTIDPFNYIDLEAEGGGVEGLNKMLVKVKRFAEQYEVLVFLVVHPVKLDADRRNNLPTGYDCYGGSHWYNRCDAGITIGRVDIGTRVMVWANRWKWHGDMGEVDLGYDPTTGVYYNASAYQEKTAFFQDGGENGDHSTSDEIPFFV